MKWLVIIALSIVQLSCPHDSNGEPVLGQDFLAAQLPAFKVKSAAKYLQPGHVTGSLDWTFGTKVAKLEPLLEKRPPYHRVHLLDTVCVRNGNCGPYSVVKGYTRATLDKAVKQKNKKILDHIRNRTAIYRGLAARFPDTKFLVSPALEHDLSKEAWRVLANTILEVWPNVQLVNSVDFGIQGERYRGAWLEHHGSKPPSGTDINSLDGTDATDTDIDAWLERTKNARIVFVWTRLFNCRTNSATFVDPRLREACPKPYHFEELSHITDTRPDSPAYAGSNCRTVRPFRAPSVWKPLAENKNNGDKRADLPVAIIGKHATTITLHSRTGQAVGSLGYYGTFGEQFRFYSKWGSGSGINGYEFEKRAVGDSGNPAVWLRAGNDCFGPLITGRRAGAYRD